MFSRILKRLSIVWLVLLASFDLLVAIFADGKPQRDFWFMQLVFMSPAIFGFALSWVFRPPN